MSEQDEQTTPPGQPRVVKKVVKRTVVRPPSASASAARTSQPMGSLRTSPPTTDDAPPAVGDAPLRSRRPSIDLGAVRRTGRSLGERGGSGISAAGSAVRGVGSATGRRLSDVFWDVRTYRLPPQPPVRAAMVVGLLLGAFSVLVGWGAAQLFTEVRGTSAGGGLWGGLVVVVLALASGWLGARLLRATSVEHAGVISGLAVLLVLTAVLLFFVDLAAGRWALLIMPTLTAAAYAASAAMIGLAATDSGRPDDAVA